MTFLTALALLEDSKDSVKMAAYQLVKSMKSIVLRLANVYTNSDIEELQEVLSIVIPMVLDDCLKSQLKSVRFFGLDILSEIVKSS